MVLIYILFAPDGRNKTVNLIIGRTTIKKGWIISKNGLKKPLGRIVHSVSLSGTIIKNFLRGIGGTDDAGNIVFQEFVRSIYDRAKISAFVIENYIL